MIKRKALIRLYKDEIPVNRYPEEGDPWYSQDWQLGVWDYSDSIEVWGLLYHSTPTHMSYEWPNSNAKAIIERNLGRDKVDPHRDWTRWYFDVGAKIYMQFDDLIPVCKALNIWEV